MVELEKRKIKVIAILLPFFRLKNYIFSLGSRLEL